MNPEYCPSRLVLSAIHQHTSMTVKVPAGTPATEAFTCRACGCDYPAGEPMEYRKPGPTFTDWQYLVGDTLPKKKTFPCCVHCAGIMDGSYLKSIQAKYSSAVYSAQGAWRMTRDAERIAFLLNPPEPPFVAFVATTMGQHVVWRCPITLDKDFIRIAFGRSVMDIDRPRLLLASQRCIELMEAIRASGEFNTKRIAAVRHPFVELARDMTGEREGLGIIRSDFRQWAMSNGHADTVVFLENLGKGELWGLSMMNKQRIEEPEWFPLP